MKTHHPLIVRPGIYHLKLNPLDGGASQRAWLDRTCFVVEGFTKSLDEADDAYDRVMASMVVHATADFLYERLGEEAEAQPPEWIESGFGKLDPAAFVAVIVRSLPSHVGLFSEVLRDFYVWLVAAGEIDGGRGQYLACYFDTLLELHGSGPTGILPTRASRRATATLARRITEARLRSQERARKRTAA